MGGAIAKYCPASPCDTLERCGWLVPIGKEMMKGEVERGRDDERHRLRGQRGYFKDQVEQSGDRECHDDAASAGDMETLAPLNPGAAMSCQVAEGNPVVWDEVRHNRDFGRDGEGNDIVNLMGEGRAF